jgi:hypothetical protein
MRRTAERFVAFGFVRVWMSPLSRVNFGRSTALYTVAGTTGLLVAAGSPPVPFQSLQAVPLTPMNIQVLPERKKSKKVEKDYAPAADILIHKRTGI